MLERESSGSGWQVSLRPKGFARFFVAAFLGVWLCGWAVGEAFAAGTLLAGLRDLFAPDLRLDWLPHMQNQAPANPWPVLVFLAVWLTGWTLGGLFALGTFARSLVGVDDVRWDHERVEVVRRVGLFSRMSTLAWSDAQAPFRQQRGAVVTDTRKGLVRITGFGSDEERRQLGEWLGAAWREARGGEAAPLAVADAPPAGWTVESAEDGRPMLVSGPGARRVGALIAGAIAAALAIVGGTVGATASDVEAWAGCAVLGLLALLAAAVAAWLAVGRVELRAGPGWVRRVIRFLGREWSREITSARLSLERSTDSDGDDRWELVASGTGGRLGLASDLHSPGVTRHMGLWLGGRMQVELEGLPEAGIESRRAG